MLRKLKLIWINFKDKTLLGKSASILMYHSVSGNRAFFSVPPLEFQRQMELLVEEDYRVIGLSDLINDLESGKEVPAKSVVITFDDGYEDNYLNALPVLKKYNFPATIFLTTGQIGNKDYESRGFQMPMLDWGQIREMHASGLIDFQPHTVSHPRLTEISEGEVKREMLESKHVVEEKLGKKCQFFAYPKGDYKREVVDLAKQIFDGAVTVKPGFVGVGDNPFVLKRHSIDSLTTRDLFKLKI